MHHRQFISVRHRLDSDLRCLTVSSSVLMDVDVESFVFVGQVVKIEYLDHIVRPLFSGDIAFHIKLTKSTSASTISSVYMSSHKAFSCRFHIWSHVYSTLRWIDNSLDVKHCYRSDGDHLNSSVVAESMLFQALKVTLLAPTASQFFMSRSAT